MKTVVRREGSGQLRRELVIEGLLHHLAKDNSTDVSTRGDARGQDYESTCLVQCNHQLCHVSRCST